MALILFTNPINLIGLIKTGKDRLCKEDGVCVSCGVIYKINCLDCESSYVLCQTKRKLKTQIKKHKVDIRKSTTDMSAVSCHQVNEKHELDWDNVRHTHRTIII